MAPGLSTGVLTVSGSVTLQGTALMELDRLATLKSDRLAAGSIEYGGTLVLTNIGAKLDSGDTFTLFSGTLSGSFSAISGPDLWPGLALDTTALNSGVISITGTMIPPQVSGGVSGTNFVLTGSGGLAGTAYVVVAAPSVTTPMVWTPIATNTFAAGGLFTTSVPIDPGVSMRYFSIRVP